MDPVMDVFSGNAFSMANLTNAVNQTDYLPARLGQLGIFEEEGVPTRNIVIEEDYGTLKLVPDQIYGGPAAQKSNDKRKARSFVTRHLPIASAITAEEIQGVRGYAAGMTPSQILLAVEELRNRKLGRMVMDLEATLEFHRIGAVRGQILDADGAAVIYNLFTEFGVSQTTAQMLLNTATTSVLKQIRQAVRLSLNQLKNTPYTGYYALCGDSFYDKFVGHATVQDKFLNWQAAATYARDTGRPYVAFPFGNVMWENYRGSVGAIAFVPTTKAYLFPIGAQGLFVTKFGPSDYIDRVNQIPSPNGLPIESRADTKHMGKGIDMEAQSNPLCLCTKPAAIVELAEDT
jgi:hypothetical protein